MKDTQVLLDAFMCSSMAHQEGCLALLLSDTAAVSADACVVGIWMEVLMC